MSDFDSIRIPTNAVTYRPGCNSINVPKNAARTSEGYQIMQLAADYGIAVRIRETTYAHPIMNCVRNYVECALLKWIAKRSSNVILDVGGSARHKSFNMWGMNPIAEEKDNFRNEPNGCRHFAHQCDCADTTEYAIATHSAYYLKENDWRQLFTAHPLLRVVFCIVHPLRKLHGYLPATGQFEMEYFRHAPNHIR
jgi:hypothetical protein